MRRLSLNTEKMTANLIGSSGIESFVISQCYQKRSYLLAMSQVLIAQQSGGSIQDFAELFALQYELLGNIEIRLKVKLGGKERGERT